MDVSLDKFTPNHESDETCGEIEDMEISELDGMLLRELLEEVEDDDDMGRNDSHGGVGFSCVHSLEVEGIEKTCSLVKKEEGANKADCMEHDRIVMHEHEFDWVDEMIKLTPEPPPGGGMMGWWYQEDDMLSLVEYDFNLEHYCRVSSDEVAYYGYNCLWECS